MRPVVSCQPLLLLSACVQRSNWNIWNCFFIALPRALSISKNSRLVQSFSGWKPEYSFLEIVTKTYHFRSYHVRKDWSGWIGVFLLLEIFESALFSLVLTSAHLAHSHIARSHRFSSKTENARSLCWIVLQNLKRGVSDIAFLLFCVYSFSFSVKIARISSWHSSFSPEFPSVVNSHLRYSPIMWCSVYLYWRDISYWKNFWKTSKPNFVIN